MDRRTTIKWVLAASASWPALNRAAARGGGAGAGGPVHGYGTDPQLTANYRPGELWPLTLTPAERQLAGVLSDLIIPADGHSPSASAVGVVDFIDEWVSAPYPAHRTDRDIVVAGCAWLNAEAARRAGTGFAGLNPGEQTRICDAICCESKTPAELRTPARFFARYRDLTAGGFYSTPAGRQDLNYIGNVPLTRFDGPPPELLKSLGLPAALSPPVPSPVADAPAGAWQPLLEDHGAPLLRGWETAGLPPGWHVAAGVLSKEGSVDDLVTTRDYANFELELDWKIGEGGNSGLFYRGTREYDHIYWSAPEYQLLDDANAPDGKQRLTAAAAAYALYAAPAGVVLPHDHWNTTRLVVRGDHVEHWLNGRKVVDYFLKSADWKAKVAASKFAEYPHYGLAERGLIGLQGDHPGALAVRNLRIRELP